MKLSLLVAIGFLLPVLQAHRGCRYGPCAKPLGDAIEAASTAEGRGTFTRTGGNSAVELGPLGVSGRTSYHGEGLGVEFSGASGKGTVKSATPFGSSGVNIGSSAKAFGTRLSHSKVSGDAFAINGHSNGAALASAVGAGPGFSRAASKASADHFGSWFRHKRSACNFPPCGTGIEAVSKGGSYGLRTASVGDSSVFSEPFSFGGRSDHRASGSGPGASGANSWTGINVQDAFGRRKTLQAGGTAEAVGSLTSTSSKSETRYLNGFSSFSSESRGQASGVGFVSPRSKRSATGEVFLNGKSAKIENENPQGSLSRIIDDGAGFSALDIGSDTHYGLRSVASSTGDGNQWGKAGGKLSAQDLFGNHELSIDEFTEAFGEGSASRSEGNVDEWNGMSFSSSGSSASVEGDSGYSSALSRTNSNN